VRYPTAPDVEVRRINREMYLGYRPEPVMWIVSRAPDQDGYYAIQGTGKVSGARCVGRVAARVRDDWLQRGVAIEGEL